MGGSPRARILDLRFAPRSAPPPAPTRPIPPRARPSAGVGDDAGIFRARVREGVLGTPAMPTVAAIRQRYEATPRALDEELTRISRGDRGCVGDLIAGVGALGVLVFGVIASMGAGGWGYMAVSAALLVGGFVASTIHQGRSGAARRRALAEGPLVLAKVLRSEKPLEGAGEVFVLSTVVFTTAPERRFDAAALDQLAARLRAPGEPALVQAIAPSPGVRAVPEALVGVPGVFVAEVAVDGARLAPGQASEGVLTMIVAPAQDFAEHV